MDWIVKQPWSNGVVGIWGLSFESVTALTLLANRHPAVKACLFDRGSFDVYEDYSHRGGIPSVHTVALSVAVREQDQNRLPRAPFPPWYLKPFFRGVLPVDGADGRVLLREAVSEHRQNGDLLALTSSVTFRDDVFFPPGISEEKVGPSSRADDISASGTPLLVLQGWFDNPGAAFRAFATLRNPRWVVVGPWNHALQNASPYAELGMARDLKDEPPVPSLVQKLVFGQAPDGQSAQDERPRAEAKILGSLLALDPDYLNAPGALKFLLGDEEVGVFELKYLGSGRHAGWAAAIGRRRK